MKVIDVREIEAATETVAIKFADDMDDSACYLWWDEIEGQVKMVDMDDTSDPYFNVEDIPNLIKALEKAYELWGDK